jgi:regulatory protein
MQKAMALLHKYPKTIEETKKYLESNVETPESIDIIIRKLIQLRFLDDFQYVKIYFERSFHEQANGPVKIAYELHHKGIDEAIIRGFIQHITPYDIERNLGILFDHKLSSLTEKPKAKAMLSMKQYLYQKGYDPDQIDLFVSKRATLFVNLDQESKLLEKDYQTLLKRYSKTDLSVYDRKAKIIQSLMTKGYRYDAIKRLIEGSNNHD